MYPASRGRSPQNGTGLNVLPSAASFRLTRGTGRLGRPKGTIGSIKALSAVTGTLLLGLYSPPPPSDSFLGEAHDRIPTPPRRHPRTQARGTSSDTRPEPLRS